METEHQDQSNTNRKSVLIIDTAIHIEEEGGHTRIELNSESNKTNTTEQEQLNAEEIQYER